MPFPRCRPKVATVPLHECTGRETCGRTSATTMSGRVRAATGTPNGVGFPATSSIARGTGMVAMPTPQPMEHMGRAGDSAPNSGRRRPARDVTLDMTMAGRQPRGVRQSGRFGVRGSTHEGRGGNTQDRSEEGMGGYSQSWSEFGMHGGWSGNPRHEPEYPRDESSPQVASHGPATR